MGAYSSLEVPCGECSIGGGGEKATARQRSHGIDGRGVCLAEDAGWALYVHPEGVPWPEAKGAVI